MSLDSAQPHEEMYRLSLSKERQLTDTYIPNTTKHEIVC